MSSARIKDKAEATAHRLFNELWDAITPDPNGAFPYPEFLAFHDKFPLLNAMFMANQVITFQEKADIISRCFIDARRTGKKEFNEFVAAVDAEIGAILAESEKPFFLTTTVSFRRLSAEPRLTQRASRSFIAIDRYYPRRLTTDAWFMNGFGEVEPSKPQAYACLYARTKSRTLAQAARTMLADVELFVACLNLVYSRGRSIVSIGKLKPLNRIRLGPLQLIHHAAGKVEREHIWYEPDYIEETSLPSLSEQIADVQKYVQTFFTRLSRSTLRDLIEPGLRQYNSALNKRDPQQCLVHLWAALEILMQSAANGSKETAKRASFLSKEKSYRQEKLQHIAELRSEYVHAGTEITLADKLVDDLKSYVREILYFMIFTNIKFRDKDQFRQMLDLPADPRFIQERIAIARMGLKTRQ